jgi:hypothetical protein
LVTAAPKSKPHLSVVTVEINVDHKTKLQTWVDMLERVESEMSQYIDRISDEGELDVAVEIRSAMLTVEDANFEISDIIEKLE